MPGYGLLDDSSWGKIWQMEGASNQNVTTKF
jgi:hypothetical protein